jgi:hypothetical protein
MVPALTVAGVAVAAGIGLAAVLVLHGRPQPAAAGGPGVMELPAPVPSVGAPTGAPEPEVAPSAVPVTNVDDLPQAPPLPEPSTSASAVAAPPPPRWGPAAPAVPKVHVDCSPPYYYGADGLKHYKRECN